MARLRATIARRHVLRSFLDANLADSHKSVTFSVKPDSSKISEATHSAPTAWTPEAAHTFNTGKT